MPHRGSRPVRQTPYREPRLSENSPLPTDPKSYARAAVLAGSLSIEPLAIERVAAEVPAIRRVVPRVRPPLDLAVIPFLYRVTAASIEPVTPKCRHSRRRSRPRS